MMIPGVEKTLSIVHRNKKGLTLNLKNEKGKDLFKKLIRKSDALVENFTPGTMDKLELGYGVLSKLQPKLIYLAISGFGRSGPLQSYPAFDLIAQASGGIMAALEQPGVPPKVMFGDLVAGAYGALGLASALFARERTGVGQLVDLSMQDVMYIHNYRALTRRTMEDMREAVDSFLGKTTVDQLLSDENRRMVFWNSYKTQDGHLAMVAFTEEQWRGVVRALGDPELGGPDFENIVQRIRNWKRGVGLAAKWFESRTTRDAVEALRKEGVPCTPVMDFDEVNQDVQLQSRDMLQEVSHSRLGTIRIPGNPLKLEKTPPSVGRAHPDLGQDTGSILSSLLGLSEDEIASLRSEGVI